MSVLLVFLLGCHHEVKVAAQVEETTHITQDDSKATTKDETRTQAATDIDTKTTRADNAVVVQEVDGSVTVAVVTPDKPLRSPKGSKVIGVVQLKSTTVEQDKHVGAKLDVTGSVEKVVNLGKTDKDLKGKTDTTTTTDTGPGWKLYLSIALLAALGIGGVLLVLKYKWWRPV